MGLMLLLAVGFATAGYIVNSFIINVDILEPFEIEYAIINTTDCVSAAWTDHAGVDAEALYPGDNGTVCYKINNLASVNLTYTFNFSSDIGCLELGNTSTAGPAQPGVTVDGVGFSVNQSAPTNCSIDVQVIRG